MLGYKKRRLKGISSYDDIFHSVAVVCTLVVEESFSILSRNK